MFENILNFFKKIGKNDNKESNGSKNKAKERLHLVLMQARANVSADFLELMKQEIIEVIKKYIEVEESEIDVRLTNEVKEDGTTGAPSLYANIPIVNIRNDMKKDIEKEKQVDSDEKNEETQEEETKNVENNEEEKKKEKEEKIKKEEEKVESEQNKKEAAEQTQN